MRQEDNRGYVVVTVAVMMVVLLGFAALAVDSGFLYDSRTAAQRVADAAALAGVFTFVTQPTAAQPATAEAYARAVATDQTILADGVAVEEVNVTVDVPGRMVTVDLNYSENVFFARTLGFTAADIGVQAVAEAGPNATGATCAKPWMLPNTILSTEEPCEACNQGEVLLQGNAVTPFGLARRGQLTVVKPGSPQDAMGPGVFSPIQMPASQGGNAYRNNIATCADVPVTCNASYSVETGNMIGPTKQGTHDLIGQPPDDTWVGIGAYRLLDGTVSDTSKALVVVPVWDVCNFGGFCPAGEFPSGTNTSVSVAGFALSFVDRVQGNDVQLRIVNVFACDGTPATDEAAPFAIPVRLVRTQ